MSACAGNADVIETLPTVDNLCRPLYWSDKICSYIGHSNNLAIQQDGGPHHCSNQSETSFLIIMSKVRNTRNVYKRTTFLGKVVNDFLGCSRGNKFMVLKGGGASKLKKIC